MESLNFISVDGGCIYKIEGIMDGLMDEQKDGQKYS